MKNHQNKQNQKNKNNVKNCGKGCSNREGHNHSSENGNENE